MAQDLGIYFNRQTNKVLRIASPYYLPSGPEWVLLTTDTNATLLWSRGEAKNKGLSSNPQAIVWGDLPQKPS